MSVCHTEMTVRRTELRTPCAPSFFTAVGFDLGSIVAAYSSILSVEFSHLQINQHDVCIETLLPDLADKRTPQIVDMA
jgi:hypothetical protein